MLGLAWILRARTDYCREGFRQFWFAWRRVDPHVRALAYWRGRFTPQAERLLDRFHVLQIPAGVAWIEAVCDVWSSAWLPGSPTWRRWPWVSAICWIPLRLITVVPESLTPETLAHEFAHVLCDRLPFQQWRKFSPALAELEREDPQLKAWLDRELASYTSRRNTGECYVVTLEYFEYGRRRIPDRLQPFYAEWIDLQPRV